MTAQDFRNIHGIKYSFQIKNTKAALKQSYIPAYQWMYGGTKKHASEVFDIDYRNSDYGKIINLIAVFEDNQIRLGIDGD